MRRMREERKRKEKRERREIDWTLRRAELTSLSDGFWLSAMEYEI